MKIFVYDLYEDISAGDHEEKNHKVRIKFQGLYTAAVVESPFGYHQSGLRFGS